MMSREEIYNRLGDIFEDVFNERVDINDSTTAEDVDGWDSLTHISLLSTVEDEFEIKFNMKAIQGLKNVGNLVDLIMELLEK